jgi:hippurate hydrolase
VLTIGVLQAGSKENGIQAEAPVKLNVRTFDACVRVLGAIERIVNGEAAVSGAPRNPRARSSATMH